MTGQCAALLFDDSEVFVAAKYLTSIDVIYPVKSSSVTYYSRITK
ncbi:MAG: hypothetical protein ACI9C3_003203 [Yoonia sp.]|jgi:hypothetical protein